MNKSNVWNQSAKALSVAVLLAFGSTLVGSTALAAEKNELNLFIWGQYTDPDIVRQFEEKYDAKVIKTNYNSLGEMFAKLQAGGVSQYDIVVPSNYYVPRLINSGLLQPLDKDKIPNLEYLVDQFVDPSFDPGNKYVVPYQWGTTGIAYDKTKITIDDESWAELFDPDANPKQPFSLSTDPQVMLGAACAYLGKSYTCKDKEDLLEAAKVIQQTRKRKNFQGFSDGTPMLKTMARGNIAVGVAYNGDLVFDKAEDPEGYKNIEFFIPKEGAELWVDNMGIPTNAPNPDLAHKWINFLMEPEIGAQLSNYNYYGTPNKASVEFLDESMQNEIVQPPAATLEHLHFTPALSGEELQYVQQLWDSVRSE